MSCIPVLWSWSSWEKLMPSYFQQLQKVNIKMRMFHESQTNLAHRDLQFASWTFWLSTRTARSIRYILCCPFPLENCVVQTQSPQKEAFGWWETNKGLSFQLYILFSAVTLQLCWILNPSQENKELILNTKINWLFPLLLFQSFVHTHTWHRSHPKINLHGGDLFPG